MYIRHTDALTGTEHFWTNRQFALRLLAVDGNFIHRALKEWQNDRDMMLTAVKQNGVALRFTPLQFREDTEIVREAFRPNKRH